MLFLCIVFHHGEGAVMNKKVAFLACLLLPLSVWSMSPVTDTDLSNVSTPPSLNINPGQTAVTGTATETLGDPKTDMDSLLGVQKLKIAPISEKDNAALISAEDTNDPNKISVSPPDKNHSMEYPNGLTNSSNGASTYIIKAGDIEMRDTYINQTNSIINSGSWVNIKTR